MKKEDLTMDIDKRGDVALFIEERHITDDELDDEVKDFLSDLDDDMIFFRIIKNGRETQSHGWIEVDDDEIEIVQWG